MEKEFVPYTEAFELKQLGFDEPCFGWYDREYKDIINYDRTRNSCGWLNDNSCSVPTYSQCFRFFREKHGLFIQPNRTIDFEGIWYYFSIETKRTDICEGSFVYENAELACLRKLIEIVKNK